MECPPTGLDFAGTVGDGERNTTEENLRGVFRSVPGRMTGIVRTDRNRKIKKPGDCRVSSLDFIKAAHSLEVLHTFRKFAPLKTYISVFRFMPESTRMQNPRRRPSGVFSYVEGGRRGKKHPRRFSSGGVSVCAGEDDGAEFAQNRQTPDRKAYFVRRGRVLAIENGK